ncbi:MAG: thiolase domain-containing protein [Candidatus Levybacteria bacterium]|nr:thiolase domain-containing protein [Candidatus Levybacteria bacterium]MDZ4228143.1 thiolase domain-containing protein [Candidatus Levybacteria bacterium]
MKINILGAYATKFGELWNVSPRALAKEAMENALKASDLKAAQIDALFVGNMLSGILGNQANLGSLLVEELGVQIPAFRMEGACASGGLALHNAINSLKAGQYKTVLVLGIEKMTDHSPEDIASALMAAGSDEERMAGATFPGVYALMAQAYMQKYKVTEEDLAAISVKNHFHGFLNSKAQFKSIITVGDVMRSSKIADPLKLLDCSPISDGAAAIIITSESAVRKSRKPVQIIASEVATDTLSLHDRKSFTSLNAVVDASTKAYKKAAIKSSDVDVAEIHDCFSISEAIAVEDLGFSKKGEGARDIAKGKRTLFKGDIITNPSGGLKACGHPVGATGIKQIVEITEQLRGMAGKRQVKGARIGLTHNVGGSGTVAVIHILKN